MTGRIKVLSNGSESGVIKAEDGISVHFDTAAVLAYDVLNLAVGQLVTYDLDDGGVPKAVNVCVQKAHPAPNAEERRLQTIRLRYAGFEQTGNIRGYRFERLSPGEDTETFLVNTDMGLFTKHRVGIQEGPALCLRLLLAELDAAGGAPKSVSQCTLTDREMLAYLASRPAPGSRPGPKRLRATAGVTDGATPAPVI